MGDMKTRILVGIGLVLLLIAVFVLGPWFRAAAFTAAAVISVYEMRNAFKKKGHDLCIWPLYGFAAICWLATIGGEARSLLESLLLIWVVAICAEQIFNTKRTMEDTICSLFVFVYPLAFYVMLANIASISANLLFLCFAGPLVGDTLAYFVGSALGRHKLCPHISPKKTIEGSIGGFFGGALGGLLTWWLGQQAIPYVEWGLVPGLGPALAIGLLCGGVGQVGDLFASAIKRWAGIKDYGKLFPGHGGMMDRLDSVLMCAPVVLICMRAL